MAFLRAGAEPRTIFQLNCLHLDVEVGGSRRTLLEIRLPSTLTTRYGQHCAESIPAPHVRPQLELALW
jgi:hypothetical protein